MSESMLDKQAQEVSNAPTVEKKGKGCFFWGCITAVAATVLVCIVLGIGVYSWLNYLKKFTSDTPSQLPEVHATEEGYADVEARIEEFKSAVDEGTSGVTLSLTGQDMNTIIAMDPEYADIRDMAYVRIEDDKLGLDVAVPLEKIYPGLEGKWLNGTAEMKVSMQGDMLLLEVETVEANGKSLPEQFMKELRGENFANELNSDPDMQELLSKVQNVKVENGQLKLVSR